jgi:hypothetical protein
MGLGAAASRRPQPTKPIVVVTKKLTNFNWRRILATPADAPGKVASIWDNVDELKVNQNEIEERFENKVG